MEKQKVVLMIANSDTAMNGFLALQECLEGRGNIKSVIVCHHRVHIENAVKRCEIPEEKLRIIKFYPKASPVKAGQRKEYHYKKDILPVSLVKAVFNVVVMVGRNISGLAKAHKIIKKEEPTIILLYADNKAEYEKFFIFWAKKKNIKTVVAPICNDVIEFGDILKNPTNGFRLNINDELPISAKIIKRMKPKEERVFESQRVFCGQPFATIIDCLMGLSAPNPWVHGSFADYVCTSYQEEYEVTAKELGDEAKEKLFLTDSVENDIIIQSYADRSDLKHFLSGKYGVNSDFIAMIAFSERIASVSKEDDLYNKNAVVQSMLKYYKDVLVSLHPKSDVEENLFLEKNEGCHILQEPLRKVIVAADVIVHGDISSVRTWVDMLGIRKVTWSGYLFWERWSDSMIQDFQDKVRTMADNREDSKDTKEIKRNISFVDFILNLQ